MAVVVPSLSTDNARDFVKDVVITTGIPPANTTVISEARAVLEFCHSTLDAGKSSHNQYMVAYGENYMIVNFKDDNIEVFINNFTKSLPDTVLFAQFIDVGESGVNEAFEYFLQEIIGKDVFQAFAKAMPEDFRCIQEEFESRNAQLDTQRNSRIMFPLNPRLLETYEAMKGQTIKEAIQESRYSKDVWLSGDKLSVSSHLVRGFFDVPVIRISMLLRSVLQTRHGYKIKSVLMTGKLSKMCEFQRAIKAAFPPLNVVFPRDPDLAAVQGAVIHAY